MSSVYSLIIIFSNFIILGLFEFFLQSGAVEFFIFWLVDFGPRAEGPIGRPPSPRRSLAENLHVGVNLPKPQ